MTDAISPRPWKWEDGWNDLPPDWDDRPKYAKLGLVDANGNDIIPLRLDHSEPEWDVDEKFSFPDAAHRAFILRAVNNHDALLAACRKLLDGFAWHYTFGGRRHDDSSLRIIKLASDAITAAEAP